MAAENNFRTTVESLFKGMDSFITTKTVVGEAITVGDTIILPLVDVSFGVGAGAFAEEKKNNGGGAMGVPDFLNKFTEGKKESEVVIHTEEKKEEKTEDKAQETGKTE